MFMEKQLLFTCEGILQLFNKIPFGVIADNRLYTKKDLNHQIFKEKWYFLQPQQVIKYQGGICWDFSNAVKFFLDLENIHNYEIYCEMNDEQKSSHSFNVVYNQFNDKYYLLDASWKKYNKLNQFDELYLCCDQMANRMFEQHKNATKISFYHLKNKAPYKCNYIEYMQEAKNNENLFNYVLRNF